MANGNLFTDSQIEQLESLKLYFPYRIVWGAIDQNGNFEAQATFDRRRLNKYLRSGWLVATVQ